MDETNNDDREKEKLKIIKSVAEESMQQEKDRSSLVQSKAQNLIKYVSTTIGIVNAILVFLLDREFINQCGLLWMALFVDVPLVISLMLAVIAQIMLKAYYYPSGIQMLSDFAEVENKELDLIYFEIYRLKCMHIYSESLCRANDIRAKCVKWSYVTYLVGLIMLLGESIMMLV